MTEEQLNQKAATIYLDHFGELFSGEVVWSSKMKTVAGNCRSDGRIALNLNYYERYGWEEMEKVLRHELVHHYCFENIGDHDHRTKLFIEHLFLIGGEMVAKPMPQKYASYECPCCKKQWFFKKKLKEILSCKTCGGNTYSNQFNIEYISDIMIDPNEHIILT